MKNGPKNNYLKLNNIQVFKALHAMIKYKKYLICLITFTIIAFSSFANSQENIDFNFGKEIDPKIVSKLDITIDLFGTNLPEGSGTAKIGEKIFINKCVSCHLENELFNQETLLEKNSIKSVPINLDWPYPKTLFDYIRKTMPYNAPQTLTNDETYSLTAYLLYKNNTINYGETLDKETLINLNSNSKNTFLDNWNKNKSNIVNIPKHNTSSFFLKLSQIINKKEEQLNWYNNNLPVSDIEYKIITQDISISPTSNNLPKGNGTAVIGEKVYQKKCLSCHGTLGIAEVLSQEIESLRGTSNAMKIIAFASLSGGLGTLNSEMPTRSVGSFWPYASTLFDYIRRAMPYFEPQSLTNDEAYAVTAYILFINNIINKEDNINAQTLQKVNMPNKAGFIDSWGPDWWREWIHQKNSIFFTCLLLLGILTVTLFARKLTQNRKKITYIKIFLTSIIFIWIGGFNSLQIGTQKIYSTFNTLKTSNGAWENILFEPIYIILGIFIIMTTFIWGRGIFCGWLCPFGTLQDIIYKFKTLLKFKTFEIPDSIHDKLIYLKYVILSSIIIGAIYSTGTNILFEFEPFRTVIENKFNTSTILILWSLVLLTFVFFIERGFCRYLCPTGAALGLASKFQVINWLITVKPCGDASCDACSPKCPTKAIKKNGSINEKECIQCLSCQIVFNDKNTICINKKNKKSIRKKHNKDKPALGTS